MPRKRPTESSWDSDEDLLEDDGGLLNILSTGREMDDVDEDALLGIGSDDEFDVDSVTRKPNIASKDRGLFATTNDAIEEEDMIQLGVDDGDDLDEADVLSRIHEQHPHLAVEQHDENVPVSEARDTEYEATFPQDSSLSGNEAAAVTGSQSSELLGTDSYNEERQPTASDEDSDSDDANATSRHRDRFRTERGTSVSAALPLAPASKADKRDIPDTLEVSQEDQEKINQFMQTQQLRGRRRMPHFAQRQSVPFRPPVRQLGFGHIPSPAMRHRPPFLPRVAGRTPLGVRPPSISRSDVMQAGGMPPRHKILVNPHFRGSPAATLVHSQVPRPQPASSYPKLMSIELSRPPQQHPQFTNSAQPNYAYHSPQAENSRPFFVQQGQRPQFVGEQPQLRQAEARLLTPSPMGSVMVHNVPASFAQPQHMPLHQISSMPQPSPHVISVAGPAASFPNQPAPQSQLYTGISVGQGIPPRQPVVFAGQPNFINQNFIGQQQGVNIVRPPGGPNIQPAYRNMEPLSHQQPSNQASFLLPNPGLIQQSPHQPMILQRLASPGGDRLPFNGSIVRAPMSTQSSLPGYVDFGGGEGNRVDFKTDFCSDPEIVGQPIETVIHNRKGKTWPGDGRATVGFRQNKPRQPFGVKNKFSSGGVGQPRATGPDVEEIEQRKRLALRARRFAAAPPTKAQSATGIVKLGIKRPFDQGLEGDGQSTAKQMRLLASRKVVAKAKAAVVQQRQNPMQQRQQPQVLQQKSVTRLTTPQSSVQQQGAGQRIPASQRLGSKSVQQQQQPVSGTQQTTPASAPRPARPISDEAAYDAELQSGLEAQKKLREQILRRKEMRRQMQVQERRHELTQHHQQQQPVTAPGQPVVPPQTNLATRLTPTASNTQFQPRQRFPATPKTVASQPRVAGFMSTSSRAPGVGVRPRTAAGTRPARPLTGTARPTVVHKVTTQPEPLVPRGTNTLPVPRRTMAPSRIAAIMMRRQYSSDRRVVAANATSVVPNIVAVDCLSTATTELALLQLAEIIGPVQNVQLNMDEKRAFILFQNAEHARQFVTHFDRTMLDQSVLSVSLLAS